MEAMGVLGFIFVLAGLSYTTKAKNDIAKLKEEFEDLRTLIEYSKKSAKNDLTEWIELIRYRLNIIIANQFAWFLFRIKEINKRPTIKSTIKSILLILGWPTIAVDTHIVRVSNRTKFAMGKNVVEVEQKRLNVVPAEFKIDVHHWLIKATNIRLELTHPLILV